MNVSSKTHYVLLISTILCLQVLGCDDEGCIRNSDCGKNEKCVAGICIPKGKSNDDGSTLDAGIEEAASPEASSDTDIQKEEPVASSDASTEEEESDANTEDANPEAGNDASNDSSTLASTDAEEES